MRELGLILMVPVVFGTLVLTSPPAAPQGINPRQSEGGTQDNAAGRSGESGGPVATVGAGTIDAVTTGSSGPQETSSGAPGEINVPPLPDASLCDDYRDTPAHQFCLSVVLRQTRS